MTEKRMEEMLADDTIELVELNEEQLSAVSGGGVLNAAKGTFTTRHEAEIFAASRFGVGKPYRYNGKRVECTATGALLNGGRWYSVCYIRFDDGSTGVATLSDLR